MSARALRITLIVLTLLGLGVASYVTYVHYAGDQTGVHDRRKAARRCRPRATPSSPACPWP